MPTRLAVTAPGDADEREADRISARVLSMPEPAPPAAAAGAAPDRATGPDREPERLQLQRVGSDHQAKTTAPAIVHDVLRSPGRPLDPATRGFMDKRFGHDFGSVRVHTDSPAARSAAQVNAHAYTVGSDIVFAAGRYAPDRADGRGLLAHELAHVIQQRAPGAAPSLQRFVASEVPKIAPTFGDMLATVRAIIDASSRSGLLGDELVMDQFVENAGGYSASRKMGKALGSEPAHVKSMLLPRYLFTCRCGLLDMRHFIQLLYMSNFRAGFEGTTQSEANRYATKEGRKHELGSEPESRFAAEDTPSNALGAFTNIGLAATPPPDAVFNAIKRTLTRCDPVDFKDLSPASRDAITHYYGDQVPDPTAATGSATVPKNQNQTALPAVLTIKECGSRERSFPYRLDTSDADRKTLAGTAFDTGASGLKSGGDIRDFVATQRPEIIRALPGAEKIRLVKVLLSGTVDADDRAAVKVIRDNATADEQDRIKDLEDLASGMYGGQTFGGFVGFDPVSSE